MSRDDEKKDILGYPCLHETQLPEVNEHFYCVTFSIVK